MDKFIGYTCSLCKKEYVHLALPAAAAGFHSRRRCNAPAHRRRNAGLRPAQAGRKTRFETFMAQRREPQPHGIVQRPRQRRGCDARPRNRRGNSCHSIHRQCRGCIGRDGGGCWTESHHLCAQNCSAGQGGAVAGFWSKSHPGGWQL
jgi:hypothetical protein